MSKTLRLLAVSALALGASFIGYNQASAVSLGSSIILAQAGGGSGGDGNTGPGAPNLTGRPGGATTPGASPSPGVPAECANMQDGTLRQQCVDRNRAASPGAMPSTGTSKK